MVEDDHATRETALREQLATALEGTERLRSLVARRATEAHERLCSCGGAGPGEGCDACEMWHAVRSALDGGG